MTALTSVFSAAVGTPRLGVAAELEGAAFTRTEPAIFVWLGVIFYLTPGAARATLEYIVGQAQPVEVILDYLQAPSTEEDRADMETRAERLSAAGEPIASHFTPDEMATLLGTLGFTTIEDRAGHDVITTYLFGQTADGEQKRSPRALRANRILRASR